jgi:hypothetical protein
MKDERLQPILETLNRGVRAIHFSIRAAEALALGEQSCPAENGPRMRLAPVAVSFAGLISLQKKAAENLARRG